MSEHVIETRDLTVYYGKHRGIKDVNLTVEKGEAFGLLGPNGAGKTTTQRVLLDVIRPTSGRATVFGMDCRGQGVELRKRVGYLPGELALYKEMRAGEFFKMYEYLRGANGKKGYWRELAERLDLDTSRRIGNFSRGNKQKVGALAAKRAQGVKLGKPKGTIQASKLDEDRERIEELLAVGLPVRKIAKVLGYNNHVGLNTYVKKRRIREKVGETPL